jgi:anion-transporting  ArsA/GET3 family ATPase
MQRQSRIIIFCGKGGVGKTTLSLALALKHAAAGKKVVVVSSHPLAELAVAVSLEGLAEQEPVAAKNLFLVHLDPKELLAELVEKNFPVPWVARAVLHSRIYRNLIEVAPGLKEFYFLARLQQLAERKASVSGAGSADYDLLLWDAPATGHFLSTLRAARSFETYLTGPLAAAGAEVARFFSNAAHIVVLPTTTLEEMAIDETVEMSAALERDYQLRAGAVVVNLVSPVVTAAEAEVESLTAVEGSSPDPAVQFALRRGLLERRRAAELRARLSALPVPVQRVRQWSGDLDLLRQISGRLEALSVEP